MEYKLQKSTNKFAIVFTGAETNKFEVMYSLSSGQSISPKLEDDKVFMDEVDKLVNDALDDGQLSDPESPRSSTQDSETELFVNIVIKAYKTTVDPEAMVEVTEM
jgi:hypothetical protein